MNAIVWFYRKPRPFALDLLAYRLWLFWLFDIRKEWNTIPPLPRRIADRRRAVRDSDGTATAADCEDNPVPQDCQARAESIAQKASQ